MMDGSVSSRVIVSKVEVIRCDFTSVCPFESLCFTTVWTLHPSVLTRLYYRTGWYSGVWRGVEGYRVVEGCIGVYWTGWYSGVWRGV